MLVRFEKEKPKPKLECGQDSGAQERGQEIRREMCSAASMKSGGNNERGGKSRKCFPIEFSGRKSVKER